MFFRRMFSRRNNGPSASFDKNRSNCNNGTSASDTDVLLNNNNSNNFNSGNGRHSAIPSSLPLRSPKRIQRRASSLSLIDDKRGLSVLQLTPLWEHIIRTRSLPEDLNPVEMFDEFLERLKDPEWQVRQHALRVLIDVLLVIGQKADNYFDPIIPQLVENLGNPAPTVRKGALDCLRVYVSHTAMPETIMLEILDIGLNQRITNEPFGGRVTCGVMLSLPSLVQSTLHTNKRDHILRSTIEMLANKMTQVTHQEVVLKVLLKIKLLIGPREFLSYMTAETYREFELLCNVYGLDKKKFLDSGKGAWTMLNSFEISEDMSVPLKQYENEFWIPGIDNDFLFESNEFINEDSEFSREKIIMETEIKINDDTLTMRILEADDEHPHYEDETKDLEDTNSSSSSSNEDDDHSNNNREENDSMDQKRDMDSVIINRLDNNTGIIEFLTDSEVEEINENNNNMIYTPRTPKRVTFGGEIVKMRTPDSDTLTTHSDNDVDITSPMSMNRFGKNASNLDGLNFLTVEIPNDYTKPVQIPPNREKNSNSIKSPSSSSPASPKKKSPTSDDASSSRVTSASPKSPFKRITVSPADNIISPKPAHKEIEVLHNLQRSPAQSPGSRVKKHPEQETNEDKNMKNDSILETEIANEDSPQAAQTLMKTEPPPPSRLKSWEDLGLVEEAIIRDLNSGDWRHRSHAISTIEESLRSSENLALVQPYLDSLLRTFLSFEKNADVAEDKRRVIMNLISRLPLDNLENRTTQIIIGLCRQGGSGSNRVSKSLMQRLPPAVIVLKLLSEDFLHTRSSRFRENALQMVMYALMTFPSTYFDTATCVTRATYAALDRKKRVRQASLDVLAILGQVTSPKTVMDIVQKIANNREDGKDLCNAVKARLSRKQLPIVSPDGYVQYALRVPSPQTNNPISVSGLGADIEWIASGIGSVSPTSLKRRSGRFIEQSPNSSNNISAWESDSNRNDESTGRRLKPPHDVHATGTEVKHYNDSTNSLDRTSNFQFSITNSNSNLLSQSSLQPPSLLQMPSIRGKTTTNSIGDIIGAHGKRIATKSCSDSSQDGRSSDSTIDGNNNTRFTRLPFTSRFPTMERLNVTGIYTDKQGLRNRYDHRYSHHKLNSTFPKANFSVYQKRFDTMNSHYQDTFTESSFDDATAYVIRKPSNGGHNTSNIQNPRRFLNVQKLMTTSNKHSAQPQSQQNSYIISNVHHHQQDVIQMEETNDAFESREKIENNSPVTEMLQHKMEENKNNLQMMKSSVNLRNCSNNANSPESRLNSSRNQNNSDFIECGEISSDDKYSSDDHSTPTRVLEDVVTPTHSAKLHNSENSISYRPSSQNSFYAEATNLNRKRSSGSASVKETSSPLKEDEEPHENSSDRPSSGFSGKSFIVQEDDENKDELDNSGKNSFTPEEDGNTAMKISTPSGSLGGKDISKTPTALTVQNDANTANELTDQIEEIAVESSPSKSIKVENNENEPAVESSVSFSAARKVNNDCGETESKGASSTSIPTISPSPSPIPMMEVKPITRESPVIKSYESIFGEVSSIKNDLDNKSNGSSSESGSDYQRIHVSSSNDQIQSASSLIHIKPPPQHIPLMRKSKTTFFGRNRRVSPVKQSIKLNKTEIFPQNLSRFEKPREALNQSFAQLDSSNWEEVMIGLRSFVRIMRYHPEILDINMHMLCIHVSKSVKNLRSQVARAGCQAAGELFSIRSKALEQECDDLVGSLLHRTSDTNRFLRADATRALESMCDNLAPSKVLHLLTTRGAAHQNSIVRTTAAKLLNRLADRMGCERIFNMSRENRDRFIITGANLLQEGSLETRSYAKALFRLLSDHHNYSRLLLEIIPPRIYRNIEKSLKNL